MHDLEKSDSAIVAAKPSNKAGPPAAEAVEPRAGAKGNADQQSTHRTQSRERVTQALSRVRQAAVSALPSNTQGRSRMLELGSSGSVRGVPSNGHPYRNPRSNSGPSGSRHGMGRFDPIATLAVRVRGVRYLIRQRTFAP